MQSVSQAYEGLKASGIWDYKSKLIKNCSKCYNQRYTGKYLVQYTESSDLKPNGKNKMIMNNNQEYIPCKCITNKLEKLLEYENQNAVRTISSDNLKGLED